MIRRLSSNSSINLIQLDNCLEINHRAKSNSLVEMFDPIYENQFHNNSTSVGFSDDKSSSNEDIFATIPKPNQPKPPPLSDDDFFWDICASSDSPYESIYPNLSSIKSSYSDERYSVFDKKENENGSNTIYDLRPSLFKELSVDQVQSSLFNDSYARKDMEKFMKTVTELQMQSLNLMDDEKSHLIFDLTSKVNTATATASMTDHQSCTVHVVVEISKSIVADMEPFSDDVDIFKVTERGLIKQIVNSFDQTINISDLFFRIFGRGEYLRHGEFPLIQNQSIFQCFRTHKNLKLVIEKLNFSEDSYRINENISSDSSSCVYQLLDQHFFNIPRDQIENGFKALSTYRNDIVSMLRDYTTSYMDISSIKASLDVFTDKCKSLCLLCNNIYSAGIAPLILDLEISASSVCASYSEKNNMLLSRSIESIIKCLDQTIRYIIQLIHEITIFCNCNFSVRPEKLCIAGIQTSETGIQSISKCRTQFSVKLGSVCSFKENSSYDSFFIKLMVKVGEQSLSKFLSGKSHYFTDAKTSKNGYFDKPHPKFPRCIYFNETINFENLNMFCLPIEARLVIKFYGRRINTTGSIRRVKADHQHLTSELIGGSEISLFDTSGLLRQGRTLVGLWSNLRNGSTLHGSSQLKSSAVLEIELPDFHVPVKHTNDLLFEIDEIPCFNLTAIEEKEIQFYVNEMWLNNSYDSAVKCCDFLWKNRGYLMDIPRNYIALCLCLVSAWPSNVEYDNKDFLLHFLERCNVNVANNTIIEIIYMLGPRMPFIKIRKWTVQVLRQIGPDDCIPLIPWLIEALKYDFSINSCELENLLLYFSVININFSTSLFWQLSSVRPEDVLGYKAVLMMGVLKSLVNNAILTMWNYQCTVVEHLLKTAISIKAVKGTAPERKNTMHTKLEELYDLIINKNPYIDAENDDKHPLCNYRIPYHPGFVLTKLEMKDCSYFNSFTLPLRIVFKGLDDNLVEVMFKSGDDLRQDILVLQLFRLMDNIWTSEGLNLHMVHYQVMSTGHKSGLVELVTDCTTLRKIQENKGIAAPLLNANGISEWLKCQNTTKSSYLRCVNNFLLTCAACCVSTYLLGIGDRHNDNIMIQTTGCVFHIDFAKILGDAQKFAGIKRDRVPFVLTQDMVRVLEDYQPVDNDRRTGMQLLIDKCCEAYNIIRRRWTSLIAILSMAAEANIPGVNSRTIQYAVKMLRLEYSDTQASEEFTDLIRKSVNSISTPMNFFIHNLAQMKYSSNNEGSLFSFTPKIYRNGPRILKISIKNIKKIRTPTKYYTFQIWVEKENLNQPEIVFRRYEHFVELGQHLSTTFSLSSLPRLYQTILQLGPPSNIVAAESRKTTLQHFTMSILELEDEISQCDLMKTFFHSTLSDEQLKEDEQLIKKTSSFSSPICPEIQLKFNSSNNGSKLEIFVKHARNLVISRFNEPPNAYVKTYILPGFIAKRKTCVIMRSSCPSFNDIITYNHIDVKPDSKIEISVWHKETLGENFCIGSIVLPLSKTLSNKEKWYPLNSHVQKDSELSRNIKLNTPLNERNLISSISSNAINVSNSKIV